VYFDERHTSNVMSSKNFSDGGKVMRKNKDV
jgi:hypothetical protein